MYYLVYNEFNEIVGRFKSEKRAIEYLIERNDESYIKKVTYTEYLEMKKKYLKNYWQNKKTVIQ